MPRNGSGTMSVSNSFTSGTTISSSEMNANFTDIASELTNSLPRDGQAAMTGQMKATNGTASLPGYTFSSDPNTGIYRVGADNGGFAAGGSLVAQWDSTGLKDSSGENYDAFDSGTKMLFYQASAPTGWTAQSINDRALRVVNAGGTGGSTGGTTAFSSVFTSRTITQANLPNVNLTAASNGAHTHYIANTATDLGNLDGTNDHLAQDGNLASQDNYLLQGNTTTPTIGVTSSDGAHTHNVPLGGSGTAMDFAVQYADVIIASKD